VRVWQRGKNYIEVRSIIKTINQRLVQLKNQANSELGSPRLKGMLPYGTE
jgi:hypothetical protein